MNINLKAINMEFLNAFISIAILIGISLLFIFFIVNLIELVKHTIELKCALKLKVGEVYEYFHKNLDPFLKKTVSAEVKVLEVKLNFEKTPWVKYIFVDEPDQILTSSVAHFKKHVKL